MSVSRCNAAAVGGRRDPIYVRYWHQADRSRLAFDPSGHTHTNEPNTLEPGTDSLTGLAGLGLGFEHPLGAFLVAGFDADQIVHVLEFIGGHAVR